MKLTNEEKILVEAVRVSGESPHTVVCLITNYLYERDKQEHENYLPQIRALNEKRKSIEREWPEN